MKLAQAWSLLTIVGIGTTLMMACAHGRPSPMVQAEVASGKGAPARAGAPLPRQAQAAAAAPVAMQAQAAAVAPAAPVQATTQAVQEQAEPEGPDAQRFAEKDRNGDGWLSGEEFALGLAPISPDEAAAMFQALDRDADGQLVVTEYFPDPAAMQASSLVPAAPEAATN
ncbi:MAG: hypothetical protein VKS61_11050 [Candidatus Sericytochromatia bacterium]|nr:hypothetical protein [Candidatus Sericytochromatia bacterium]